MSTFFSKLFGNKSDRDVSSLRPIVEKIHEEESLLEALSHDELRLKTIDLQNQIQDFLLPIDDQIKSLTLQMQDEEMEVDDKANLYAEIDGLKKDRDKELEKVLLIILPAAFAVMKETAKRFKENTRLEVTASDLDRKLAKTKDFVTIKGDKAEYVNTWKAAGTPIVWDMVHYDVQLIGGMVLHQGKIAEMATGEGKTLVATLPAYLNALAGNGVHIVTVNDYLSRRDSDWMGPLYMFHGLTVDCIDKHEPNSEERRQAYLADITFGTNNEFGFDYLRDNMARGTDDLVQRKLHYAMVDEVDSVLIDDARTPLIISGPIPRGDEHEFYELKPRIERLVNAQKTYLNTQLVEAKKLLSEKNDAGGGLALFRFYRGLPKNKALIKYLSEPGIRQILQKTENYYLQDQSKEMHKVDLELYFVIDEKNNQIELTEKGIELITKSGEDPHFFILPDVGSKIAEIEKQSGDENHKAEEKEELMRDYSVKSERIHSINQLLKAYTLFDRDIEYILDEGKIKLVDEQTGRILDGRRYSDGLHQAIEAKENVRVEDATQTYATVTLQNYFRMYHKLCGMTGTAVTEAGEFWEIYKLDVIEIPTNKKMVRKDEEDMVFKTMREKYNAVSNQIQELTKAGRPVLVGTTSVEISELISRMLKLKGIKHNVLNAKLHQKEADIVAEAGKSGTVTIATNMAGRGTDIKLGEGVKDAGGLAIVGTERHESRRVDRQLRGRSGRQGDPGTTQFYVSLEDNLMRLFGSERIAGLMDKMGLEEGEVIQHSMISKSIERAQKKVEENNFGIRKRLLEYDDVMNSQRTVIYAKRHNALFGDRLQVDLHDAIYDVLAGIVEEYHGEGNLEGLKIELLTIYSHLLEGMDSEGFRSSKTFDITHQIFDDLMVVYRTKTQRISDSTLPILRDILGQKNPNLETIFIPFTDGHDTYNIPVNLKKGVESKGKEIVKNIEQAITLDIIDEAWKEHLREMDELRNSVQNAVYEQKDPLLVYKFESYELFKVMLIDINRKIVSFLFKGSIPAGNEKPLRDPSKNGSEVSKKLDLSKLSLNKAEFGNDDSGDVATQVQPKIQPVRVEKKVGRNEPCPCGSGKKYKHCHGLSEN